MNGAFFLGDWGADPSLNLLSRGEKCLHVRPKVMDVLVFLAKRDGEVVSKEELIDAVWAKEFIADSALSRAVFELRELLGDSSQQPEFIETIPKRGYRLVAPVVPIDHAPPACPDRLAAPASPAAAPEGPAESTNRDISIPQAEHSARDEVPVRAAVRAVPTRRGFPWRAPYAFLGATALAAAAVLFAASQLRTPEPAYAPANARIVVLPFENLGAPEDDYFAAGMTEEINGRLA
ncbi:MAG: winged helix-turn-helix domain-containing protein, partial [Acidobacteriota bacterium]